MALEFFNFQVELDFRDNGNDSAPRFMDIDPSVVDYADALAAAEAAIPLWLATTDDVLAGWTLKARYLETSINLPDSSGVQNENQAFITMPILGNPKKSANLAIPAAKSALFVASEGRSANIVNSANTALLNLLALFTTPAVFTISDGEKITTTGVYGRRRHVKNGRG